MQSSIPPRSRIALLVLGVLTAWSLSADAGKIYYSVRGDGVIQRANLDGTNVETIVPNAGSNVRGIALDLARNQFFYADNGADVIYRVDLDGSNRVVIVEDGNLPVAETLGFPADLAIDAEHQLLYWCDRDRNRIERANFDGSGRETVVSTNQPYYLDLDVPGGKLYWGDFAGGNIFRADLADGGNVETLVSGLDHTRGVKLDPAAGYMYWCDRDTHKVQRRKIAGGPIEDLYTGLDTPHGLVLDSKARKMYWADTGTNNVANSSGPRTISRGDMDGSGLIEELIPLNQPWDLDIDPTDVSYDEWVARHFSFSGVWPPGQMEPSADLDGDRLKNLVEFFYDRSPFSSEPGSAALDVRVRGDGARIVTYPRRKPAPTGVVEEIQWSRDLITWRSGAPEVEVLGAEDLSNGTESVSVRLNVGDGSSRPVFARLHFRTTAGG